jgi:O-acetyl-ADP-ribose deacetylase (regulator of RNase III)
MTGITYRNIHYHLIQGDITTAGVDVIVNAANAQLAGGGGVDGAIHRASGPKLLQAGRKIVQKHGLLLPGQAVITPGFNLKAPYVIHTVGPVWRGGTHGEAEQLASCYRSCLDLAKAYRLKSIAFPAISCGVFGYPKDTAAAVSLAELLKRGADSGLSSISVYLFSVSIFTIWATQFAQQAHKVGAEVPYQL